MQVIRTLLNQHRSLYTRFDELEHMLPSLMTLPQLQCQVAPLGVALQRHAVLEERVLFTALAPHLGEINPLAMMRGEHDGIDHLLAALLQLQDLRKTHAGVQFLLEVARMHCAREEQLLYPLAQGMLSSQELQQLAEIWTTQQVDRMWTA
jgi:hemerythrin-like domain-containing protein